MSTRQNLSIEYLGVSQLRPFANNARTHSKKQVRQIADSIEAFGFTNPVLIDDAGTILAGHGRVAAAKLLGMKQVPCVRLSEMTSSQKRAYVLADNKLALNAGWDEGLLAVELEELAKLEIDIELTGFSALEIDSLIEPAPAEEAADPADDKLPPLNGRTAVTQRGDLWLLDRHKVYCGDSRDAASFQAVLGRERAQMVFTDPPYNVRIDGNVGGLGKVRHREFAMASGEMSPAEFERFLKETFTLLARFSADGSIHFVCMDWRHLGETLAAGTAAYSELKNICVWVKDNGGMGTFYRSRHELVLTFKSGAAAHINNFELGQGGRYRTNVWTYRGMNSRGSARDSELALHPTVKPVALIADAVRDVSNRNGIVLDCFGGSGSTLIAAHKTGRRGRVIEIDPIYVDRMIMRWQEFAKDDAVLATGQTFAQVVKDRARSKKGAA
jgi:DNA modification methylase